MTRKAESLARPEIVAMKPYSSARTEASAEGILLNANEMPLTLLSEADRTRIQSSINRYPEPQPVEIVRRLAEIYDVEPDNLLVTRGSDEGIDLLVRVFCQAGQDAILDCPPGFGMYRIAAQTQGANVITAPRNLEQEFRLDVDLVLQRLKDNHTIKLVFLTSPNNPTGDLIDRADLVRILRACEGQSLVILDEAYIEFCPEKHAVELLDQFEHLVILRTLSKAWAAAGLRCGTVIAKPEIIGLLRRIIAPYPLAGPVIDVVNALLEPEKQAAQQTMITEVLAAKKRLCAFLEKLPYIRNLWPGEANFVLIRVDAATEFLAYCAKHGVILRGFNTEPLLDGCIRISIGSMGDIDVLTTVMTEFQERRQNNG